MKSCLVNTTRMLLSIDKFKKKLQNKQQGRLTGVIWNNLTYFMAVC